MSDVGTIEDRNDWADDDRTCDPVAVMGAFIGAYKHCNLVVCTGTTSIHGIARLADLVCKDHKVTIILGKIDDPDGYRYGAKSSFAKRRKVLEFLRRDNVQVYHYALDGGGNWRKERVAHAKGVVAIDKETKEVVVALIGSPNLTHNGLSQNYELLVHAHQCSFPSIKDYINAGTHPDYRADDVLIEVIENGANVKPPEPAQTDSQRNEAKPKKPEAKPKPPAPKKIEIEEENPIDTRLPLRLDSRVRHRILEKVQSWIRCIRRHRRT